MIRIQISGIVGETRERISPRHRQRERCIRERREREREREREIRFTDPAVSQSVVRLWEPKTIAAPKESSATIYSSSSARGARGRERERERESGLLYTSPSQRDS